MLRPYVFAAKLLQHHLSQSLLPVKVLNNGITNRPIHPKTTSRYCLLTQSPFLLLPPLLFAGIILEGGVISYDTNVMTGGIGARYFGLGAGAQYRQSAHPLPVKAKALGEGGRDKKVEAGGNKLSDDCAVFGNPVAKALVGHV
jgi:hypothetical protein